MLLVIQAAIAGAVAYTPMTCRKIDPYRTYLFSEAEDARTAEYPHSFAVLSEKEERTEEDGVADDSTHRRGRGGVASLAVLVRQYRNGNTHCGMMGRIFVSDVLF